MVMLPDEWVCPQPQQSGGEITWSPDQGSQVEGWTSPSLTPHGELGSCDHGEWHSSTKNRIFISCTYIPWSVAKQSMMSRLSHRACWSSREQSTGLTSDLPVPMVTTSSLQRKRWWGHTWEMREETIHHFDKDYITAGSYRNWRKVGFWPYWIGFWRYTVPHKWQADLSLWQLWWLRSVC